MGMRLSLVSKSVRFQIGDYSLVDSNEPGEAHSQERIKKKVNKTKRKEEHVKNKF